MTKKARGMRRVPKFPAGVAWAGVIWRCACWHQACLLDRLSQGGGMGFIETGNGERKVAGGLQARASSFHEIPLIDFGPMLGDDPVAKQATAQALRQAAIEVGFFYVTNHG